MVRSIKNRLGMDPTTSADERKRRRGHQLSVTTVLRVDQDRQAPCSEADISIRQARIRFAMADRMLAARCWAVWIEMTSAFGHAFQIFRLRPGAIVS